MLRIWETKCRFQVFEKLNLHQGGHSNSFSEIVSQPVIDLFAEFIFDAAIF